MIDLWTLRFDHPQTLGTVLSIALTCAVAIAISYFGLFGGADAKALIFVSATTPLPPQLLNTRVEHLLPSFPISVLDNTLAISVLVIPYAIFSNIAWVTLRKRKLFTGLESESPARKLTALLLCLKMEKTKTKPYHMPAERIEVHEDGSTSRRLKLFTRVWEREKMTVELYKLPDELFISFSLPLLIFMTIGYVAALLVGDMVFLLVARLLYTG